ncbi:hypothetical protein FGO68_gene630 [Halteria grandinella]|uniref:Uncharacterized protein n=1 Tax=Halteria grandinella TaxID=5974 RepID=A0A8J8NVA1_HALGN|nr:hypothetical protein FGO68_gene630 [Halteria grandinella]
MIIASFDYFLQKFNSGVQLFIGFLKVSISLPRISYLNSDERGTGFATSSFTSSGSSPCLERFACSNRLQSCWQYFSKFFLNSFLAYPSMLFRSLYRLFNVWECPSSNSFSSLFVLYWMVLIQVSSFV